MKKLISLFSILLFAGFINSYSQDLDEILNNYF